VIFGLDSFLELVNCFFSCYFDSKGLLFTNDPAVKEVEVGGGHSEFWGVEGWTIVLKPLSLSTTSGTPLSPATPSYADWRHVMHMTPTQSRPQRGTHVTKNRLSHRFRLVQNSIKTTQIRGTLAAQNLQTTTRPQNHMDHPSQRVSMAHERYFHLSVLSLSLVQNQI